jgi:hypothetical protein
VWSQANGSDGVCALVQMATDARSAAQTRAEDRGLGRTWWLAGQCGVLPSGRARLRVVFPVPGCQLPDSKPAEPPSPTSSESGGGCLYDLLGFAVARYCRLHPTIERESSLGCS